ncbi:hypothetical protein QBC46DRAFT_346698 [Diplogelasinospora grovesii]|uniref:Uncharacterized protein n=1 Tax=Diplogelasinospora grovesii TaxID=303347 RepID=A0AAN6MXJ9_9PEZI|nr:hypothetical protein QBC46DRAFT_346698 [Diplogelasinospora grovesii]
MSITQPSPPWGAFPAEQYLIRNWDSSSPLSATGQRRELIRAFLKLDTIPQEWDTTGRGRAGTPPMERIPTEDEVRGILEPWRPLRWREAALHIWKDRYDEAIWLCTHYGEEPESGGKFQEWRQIDGDYDPAFEEDNVSWTVLDDAADVFDFGDDWGRVFDVLPEIAGPIQGWSRSLGVEVEVHPLQQKLHDAVRAAEEGDAESEAEYGIHGMELQAEAVSTFLIVADAEAWDTGRLSLLYLDAKGNIVRHSRIAPEEVFEVRHQFIGKKFRDSSWWVNRDDPTSGLHNEPGGVLGEKQLWSLILLPRL